MCGGLCELCLPDTVLPHLGVSHFMFTPDQPCHKAVTDYHFNRCSLCMALVVMVRRLVLGFLLHVLVQSTADYIIMLYDLWKACQAIGAYSLFCS